MVPAREFENTIKKALKDLGKNKVLIDYSIKNTTRLNKKKIKPLDTEKEKTENRIAKAVKEIRRLVKIMKSQDLVGNEITDEYRELLNERKQLETQKEKLELEIERCKQDVVDVETIKKTLHVFDKVISVLPIEDQKELLQLIIKEIRVFRFDPSNAKKKPHGKMGLLLRKSELNGTKSG